MLAEEGRYPVAMMARLLHVSRSGYYSWKKRPREDRWAKAKDEVKRCWRESDKRFGARFIQIELPYLTLYRVQKIMRDLGICGVTPKATKRTTIPDKDAPFRPDLVRRDFTSPVPTYKLVGDITYLKTGQGWLFLATVIDLNTRMVVGWSLSERMTADIAVNALEMARKRGYVAENAIFHSDRGSQYTSRKMALWAKRSHVRLSVGRTGSCHDNAVAESFFATLKKSMYSEGRSYNTRNDARVYVVEFIESFYNRKRPHSSIGYKVPAVAMQEFFDRTKDVFVEEKGERRNANLDNGKKVIQAA